MRPLEELLDTSDPAITELRATFAQADRSVEVLPPSTERDAVLLALQVSTRSALGAIAHETGGVLVDHGWIRILGSGSERLPRRIDQWNQGRGQGFLLVADDVLGGFFAINGGALGDDAGSMYYWPADTLQWEAMEIGYSSFLEWVVSDGVLQFYEGFRWAGWEADVQALSGEQCFNFYPPLWSAEGNVNNSARKPVSVAEQYAVNLQFLKASQPAQD